MRCHTPDMTYMVWYRPGIPKNEIGSSPNCLSSMLNSPVELLKVLSIPHITTTDIRCGAKVELWVSFFNHGTVV